MAASSLEDKSHKKQFLCLFAQEHSDFRLSVIETDTEQIVYCVVGVTSDHINNEH